MDGVRKKKVKRGDDVCARSLVTVKAREATASALTELLLSLPQYLLDHSKLRWCTLIP
jgi:hypothetical protein